MTQRKKLTEELKTRWMSAYQMQQFLKSSSGDRVMRFIREEPPKDYEIVSRSKKEKGYNNCFEFKLLEVNSEEYKKNCLQNN